MSYHHFTPFERGKIEELSKQGYTTRKIALCLSCHHSSVARELKRSGSDSYKAEEAQQDYQKKRKNSDITQSFTTTMKFRICWNVSRVNRCIRLYCLRRIMDSGAVKCWACNGKTLILRAERLPFALL